jgi:transcriptional regulator with XRE-family HTH domain
MRKPAPVPSFPEFLRQAIVRRGFQTPTDFARTARIHPSVVSRWANGEIRPTIPLLQRAAAHLDMELSTLVYIAYPEIKPGMAAEDDRPDLHPLAAELNRYLVSTTLSEVERDTLARLVDAILAQHRRSTRTTNTAV